MCVSKGRGKEVGNSLEEKFMKIFNKFNILLGRVKMTFETHDLI